MTQKNLRYRLSKQAVSDQDPVKVEIMFDEINRIMADTDAPEIVAPVLA
jgi:hypothetical protein